MANAIEFTYSITDEKILKRAMKAACEPLEKSRKWGKSGRIICFALLFIVALIFQRAKPVGLSDQMIYAFLAGVISALLLLFAFLSFANAKQLKRSIASETERGTTFARFSCEQIELKSSFGDMHLNWRAVKGIVDLGNAIGIRTDVLVFPFPHAALPEGLTPQDFHNTLENWMNSGHS